MFEKEIDSLIKNYFLHSTQISNTFLYKKNQKKGSINQEMTEMVNLVLLSLYFKNPIETTDFSNTIKIFDVFLKNSKSFGHSLEGFSNYCDSNGIRATPLITYLAIVLFLRSPDGNLTNILFKEDLKFLTEGNRPSVPIYQLNDVMEALLAIEANFPDIQTDTQPSNEFRKKKMSEQLLEFFQKNSHLPRVQQYFQLVANPSAQASPSSASSTLLTPAPVVYSSSAASANAASAACAAAMPQEPSEYYDLEPLLKLADQAITNLNSMLNARLPEKLLLIQIESLRQSCTIIRGQTHNALYDALFVQIGDLESRIRALRFAFEQRNKTPAFLEQSINPDWLRSISATENMPMDGCEIQSQGNTFLRP